MNKTNGYAVNSAYQFTLWLTDIGACHDWVDWLHQRGIPVAIVSRESRPRFSVWRGGQEQSEGGQGDRWRHDYAVVKATSGFLPGIVGTEAHVGI